METLKVIRKDKYCIVQLNRGKVNAINFQMVNEIRETFKALQADEEVQGVIMTGIPHFFTAGLDVIELYDYDREKMNEFFIAFGSMYIELAQFPKAFICAIPGYSPAGGTVIAIAADYRIMAEGEKYMIGLNEVAVNIQISQNLVEGYAFWIGKGQAHKAILDGKLFGVKEAKEVGLIDEVVALEDVLSTAETQMQKYLQADPDIFINSKYKLRKEWLASLDTRSDSDLKQSMEIWWKPEVRVRMKAFVDRLQKKV